MQRLDDGRRARAERALDHDDVAGTDRGQHLRLERGGVLCIAATAADGKSLPKGPHQRPAAEHQIDRIRQHRLDASLVKSYATDFCGVKTLRQATREQVENFVAHLADWAEKDRTALTCQLNSYLGQKEGAA